MPRAGLTTAAVVDTAAVLADEEGPASLTLTRVANELGVKAPSLYNHVEGREGMERLVALDGLDRLADVCRSAVMGLAGPSALQAIARAYRTFAVEHPGVYTLTQVARPGDPEYEAASSRLLEPVLAILAGFGLPQGDLIHAARSVRSALHGFAVLESGSGFGLDVDLDDSFAWMVDWIERGLAAY